MPTCLVLRFPSGHRHGTPWGRPAHDAGAAPPSPWRLVRTLHSAWRTRVPSLDADTVRDLLTALAMPPTFHLPWPGGSPASGTATELAAVWPVDLAEPERVVLERLAGVIPYLERVEHPCSAFVAPEWQPDSHTTWVPLDLAESIADTITTTSVLAPQLPLHPDCLLDRATTARNDASLIPRGTRLVAYQRVKRQRRPRLPAHSPHGGPVTAVRFRVHQMARPPQTDAVAYTDLLRQAALHNLGKLRPEQAHTQLGGRTTGGKPVEGHGHAHYLPLFTDQRLGGILVWAPGGLPDDELTALTAVERLYSPEGWRLAVRADRLGDPANTAPELGARASVWTSVTPFTPSRYAKANGNWLDFLRAEIDRELTSRDLPSVCALHFLPDDWTSWRRHRPSARKRGDSRQGRANRPSTFLRVELTEPTTGPIALGHLSHFGLGLFTSMRPSTDTGRLT